MSWCSKFPLVSIDITNTVHYYALMIRSFADKQSAAIFEGHRIRPFPLHVQDVARRKLKAIDAAKAINDLRVPPGNRLERLSGARKGQWSIRINDQWRACFHWENGDAHDVQITDYH
jgi:proteic killer suppression protein